MNDVNQPAPPVPPRPLPMMQAAARVFRKAFVFSGRARPAEFWKFVLFCILVQIVLTVIWSAIFGPAVTQVHQTSPDGRMVMTGTRITYGSGWPGSLFTLLTLIPTIAVAARRLHDRDKSGWWQALPFAISFGGVILLALSHFGFAAVLRSLREGGTLVTTSPNLPLTFAVMLASFGTFIYVLIQLIRAGTPGPNRFGPNPLEVNQ
ncbi:DUF805 domain-containing protein [Paracoccus sp. p2-l61]